METSHVRIAKQLRVTFSTFLNEAPPCLLLGCELTPVQKDAVIGILVPLRVLCIVTATVTDARIFGVHQPCPS